jgi:uncharacterized protein YecE (DUF72 family)
MAQIRAGIGGWDFAPWRETFYPKDVPVKKQLNTPARNSPASKSTAPSTAPPSPNTSPAGPPKRPMISCSRSRPRATPPTARCWPRPASRSNASCSGLTELGDKLGPILWQLANTKQFDPDDLEAFFKLLPAKLGKRKLQHVLDARHDSFLCDDYLKLARKYKIATVITDSPKYPNFTELTGEFAYARLMNAQSEIATGYTKPALKKWARQAQDWQQQAKSGKAYVYFINGAKERAPLRRSISSPAVN